jgi:hypothetical protein
MNNLGRACIAAVVAVVSTSASADPLPPLKLSAKNNPPACVTPGRLMAMIHDRNPALRERFAKIAVAYMREGEALGIRWDYAFYQMIVETNALKFTGDVRWTQNNFAGLGAIGNGARGERFSTVSDGAKAHLQHLMVYAGMPVADPVADRTRKIQEWGVLDKWHRRIRHPVTFAQIGRQWAPGDRGYADDIKGVAKIFMRRYCNAADPNPEMVAEARGSDLKPTTVATTQRPLPRDQRSGLGVGVPAKPQVSAAPPATAPPSADTRAGPNYTVLNSGSGTTPPVPPNAKDQPRAPGATASEYTVASAAGAAGAAAKFAAPFMRPDDPAPVPPPAKKPQSEPGAAAANPPAPDTDSREVKTAEPTKCRVWTASYGGQKAIIIRSVGKGSVNFTVLDVNDGREDREAAAYIAAYAKGGKPVGTFKNQTLALEKAFKLCPSG